jgi:hypothetical protein
MVSSHLCLTLSNGVFLSGLYFSCYMSHPPQPSFDHANNIDGEYKLWSSSLHSFLSSLLLLPPS